MGDPVAGCRTSQGHLELAEDEGNLVCRRPVALRGGFHEYNISKGNTMTQRATTSLSLHYQVKPSQKEGLLVEIKGMLDRCAKEPEFIMGILHETPERPNQLVLYELWKGTRAEFDATQGTKPYRNAYIENTKKFLDKVDVEWNLPILEWGTNLTGLNQS